MTSIRIFIRRFNELDLRIKEVPEGDCRVEVEAQSTGDNHVHLTLTFYERGMSADTKGDVDNPVNDAPSENVVAKGDGDVVGVGDAFSHFNSHQERALRGREFQKAFNNMVSGQLDSIAGQFVNRSSDESSE